MRRLLVLNVVKSRPEVHLVQHDWWAREKVVQSIGWSWPTLKWLRYAFHTSSKTKSEKGKEEEKEWYLVKRLTVKGFKSLPFTLTQLHFMEKNHLEKSILFIKIISFQNAFWKKNIREWKENCGKREKKRWSSK